MTGTPKGSQRSSGHSKGLGRRSQVLIEFVQQNGLIGSALGRMLKAHRREELEQCVYMAAWHVLQTEEDDDDAPLVAKAVRQARFRAIDYLREIPAPLPQIRDEEPRSTRDHTRIAELWDSLEHRLSSLPERYRDMLMPYFTESCTAKEVAQRAGVSESWVCQLLRSIGFGKYFDGKVCR